ncbi:MAG: PhoU domain-containing protein [bacterium]
MIKYIIDFIRRNRLMDVIEADVRSMYEQAQTVFDASCLALLEGKSIDFDIYARDRKINLLVVNTRKRVVEHLSVGEIKSPVGELTFISLINNIERIGDHSKNLFDLYRRLHGPLYQDDYYPRIVTMRDYLTSAFSKTQKSLFEDDDKTAHEVMDGHLQMVKDYERMVTELFEDDNIETRQALAILIIIRSFKRVSAHLKTISSAAVNPFMLMGYRQMPEVEKEKGPKDEDSGS